MWMHAPSAVAIPAALVLFAMNNRREGVKEGQKAAEYPQMGKFGSHPPPERSG
jgi:hypothetical protein